ncbi:Uncharacterised protein [Moraxella caprae]|uniref:Uncharacterized protein n=1 Tax=Moraxella caprae TaxID=90240 RepID=A0A378R2S1_9GAMM|nr:Uncharacterised protein [Moraxella caprae]
MKNLDIWTWIFMSFIGIILAIIDQKHTHLIVAILILIINLHVLFKRNNR